MTLATRRKRVVRQFAASQTTDTLLRTATTTTPTAFHTGVKRNVLSAEVEVVVNIFLSGEDVAGMLTCMHGPVAGGGVTVGTQSDARPAAVELLRGIRFYAVLIRGIGTPQ